MKAKLQKPAELFGRRAMCTPRPGFRLGQARTSGRWHKVARRVEARRQHLEWSALMPPWRASLFDALRVCR